MNPAQDEQQRHIRELRAYNWLMAQAGVIAVALGLVSLTMPAALGLGVTVGTALGLLATALGCRPKGH
jgi:uncharacterized membrane protein HdeD (DUF308 family)